MDKAARRGRDESVRPGTGPICAVPIMLHVSIASGVAGTQGVTLVAAALIDGTLAMTVAAAWVVPVPVSALLAAMLDFMIFGRVNA